MIKLDKLLTTFGKRKLFSLQSIFYIGIASSVLLYLLFSNKDLILENNWVFRFDFLGGAFIFYGLSLLIGAFVWHDLLNQLDVRIGFLENFRYYCLNMLARRIPGSIWYILYRTRVYSTHGISAAVPALASGIEMVIAIVSAILVFFGFGFQVISQFVVGPWLLIGIVLTGLVILNPKVLRWVFHKFGKDIEPFKMRSIIIWICSYSILWIFSGTIVFLSINSITQLSWNYLTFVIGGWSFVSATSYLLLFLPTNLGFSEVSLSLLLTSVIPSSIAVVATIYSRVCFIFFEIIWTSLTLLLLKNRKPLK